AAAVSVSVLVSVSPLSTAGAKLASTFAGRPVTSSVTAPSTPPTRVRVTSTLASSPRTSTTASEPRLRTMLGCGPPQAATARRAAAIAAARAPRTTEPARRPGHEDPLLRYMGPPLPARTAPGLCVGATYRYPERGTVPYGPSQRPAAAAATARGRCVAREASRRCPCTGARRTVRRPRSSRKAPPPNELSTCLRGRGEVPHIADGDGAVAAEPGGAPAPPQRHPAQEVVDPVAAGLGGLPARGHHLPLDGIRRGQGNAVLAGVGDRDRGGHGRERGD